MISLFCIFFPLAIVTMLVILLRRNKINLPGWLCYFFPIIAFIIATSVVGANTWYPEIFDAMATRIPGQMRAVFGVVLLVINLVLIVFSVGTMMVMEAKDSPSQAGTGGIDGGHTGPDSYD